MKDKRLFISLAQATGFELQYIQEALTTSWITSGGPNVTGFETDLEGYLGHDVQVAALSSGTAALHLGLVLLGVQAGDVVIC